MSQPVLICRPGNRGEALADSLRAQGASVEHLNVMRLEPLPEDHVQRSVWLDIDQYHKIVVVSPFAAYCLSEALDRYWPQLPVGIDYYSVGRATANMLFEQLGVRVHIPSPDYGEDTSEALLSLASLKTLTHQRILLVAGEGGRSLLADTLSARGANVTRIAVYRRVYQAPTPALQQRLLTGDYRALIATSGELLQHLARWCEQAALNQPLIVSSHRLAKLAGKLGFRDLKVASGATPAALAAALGRSCNPKGADVDQGT
ncbi:uroporphyrinogen-III synthase [Halomonas sp. XH26]|uniref:Uroporphyrinogen-III synthase n=1 Tax=Vreelandella alkaliphila TaxID=272774 RepID=A0AAJ2RWS4_9GAMM|nr:MULTISPECIES: uroporphyrinogen-III synthase [Halomonas]AIA74342.1 uroporphyrinogen III synthase [Halomonas campaniensis]MCD6005009.1 uroporphyrinogen-III synthase [Halomonas sp. IOP_6]MDX5977884.1 uroporphyrinogen-III synthase [Halomonas alkaliphila]UTA79830.1 uroporphyrinogen-III synthase [Halomonas sp. XH26]